MKRSILSLIYLIQGMRKAGIEIDQKLKNIGLRADAVDPSFIIHPRLEGNILKIIGQHYAFTASGSVEMLLGYSELAAFNHAFKRWFGYGPHQYFK